MKNILPALIISSLSFASTAQPWQTMADIPLDFVFPVVVELRGNIHVLGGGSAGTATDMHVRYSPSTDTWDTLASLPDKLP